MYLLRRHFGISAREALTVLPAWEVRMLLEQLARDEEPAPPETGPREGAMTITGEEVID